MRLRLAALCIALVFALGTSVCETPPRQTRPNIVLIIADDQDWRDFGFMGHPHIQTPTIDSLARAGTVFTGGLNSGSICRPSLRTLLTGMYPHQWDARIDRLAQRGITYEPWEEVHAFATLPRLLAQRGYSSFQAGKHWEGTYADAGFTDGMTDERLAAGGAGLSLIRNGGIDPALDFIDANVDRPFFLWFAPMLPHVPHNAPRQYRDLHAEVVLPRPVVDFYAAISWLDSGVEQLLDHIEQRGLSERTLVVFLTDNGWVQPTTPFPIGWRNGLGGAGGKLSPNEAGLRTPVIFHWPGYVPQGAVVESMITTSDVWRTILAYAGSRHPVGRDATNLKPLLDWMSAPGAPRAWWWRGRESVALSLPLWDLYVTEQWWAIWHDNGQARLHDRIGDPEQRRDLALANPDLVATLRLAFEAELVSHGRGLFFRP